MEEPRRHDVEEENFPYDGRIPNVGNPPADMMQTADFFKWSFDPDRMLKDLEHELKGEISILKGDEEIYKEVEGRKVMNDKGVNKIIMTIRPAICKELTMADISKKMKEAHLLTRYTMEIVIDMIYLNYWEWEVNASLYKWIVKEIDTFIFLALTRIEDGGIKSVIRPTIKRIETYAPQQKRGGMFGGIFDRK